MIRLGKKKREENRRRMDEKITRKKYKEWVNKKNGWRLKVQERKYKKKRSQENRREDEKIN